MDLGVAGVGAGGGSLLPQLGVWGSVVSSHIGVQPLTAFLLEEISSFLRLGGCGPAFNSTDSDSGHSEVYVLAILTLQVIKTFSMREGWWYIGIKGGGGVKSKGTRIVIEKEK